MYMCVYVYQKVSLILKTNTYEINPFSLSLFLLFCFYFAYQNPEEYNIIKRSSCPHALIKKFNFFLRLGEKKLAIIFFHICILSSIYIGKVELDEFEKTDQKTDEALAIHLLRFRLFLFCTYNDINFHLSKKIEKKIKKIEKIEKKY